MGPRSIGRWGFRPGLHSRAGGVPATNVYYISGATVKDRALLARRRLLFAHPDHAAVVVEFITSNPRPHERRSLRCSAPGQDPWMAWDIHTYLVGAPRQVDRSPVVWAAEAFAKTHGRGDRRAATRSASAASCSPSRSPRKVILYFLQELYVLPGEAEGLATETERGEGVAVFVGELRTGVRVRPIFIRTAGISDIDCEAIRSVRPGLNRQPGSGSAGVRQRPFLRRQRRPDLLAHAAPWYAAAVIT